MSQLKQRKQMNLALPYSAFLFYSGPEQISWCLPALVKIIFTKSTNSNTNLFWNDPHRHIWENVLSTMWASLSPVKLTYNVNHPSIPKDNNSNNKTQIEFNYKLNKHIPYTNSIPISNNKYYF